jgi:hypothetical protein
VERLRLAETLRATKFVNADVAETLKPLEKQVEVLSRRIELVRLLDATNDRLAAARARTSGVPPTRLDEVARLLADASRMLERTDPTEAALTEVQTAIQTAEVRLTQVGGADPAFAKLLAERITERGKWYAHDIHKGGRRRKCDELRRLLPDVFEVLEEDRFGKEMDVKPGHYAWADRCIEKLYVLRHYILRFDDSSEDSARQERIRSIETDLVRNLRLQDWYALDRARRLRRKVEEDIFEVDVDAALRHGQFEIQIAPITVYANDPVTLSVVFTDPRLNHCTARGDFKCLWQFAPNVGREEGWRIQHYFRARAEAHVTVRLQSKEGEELVSRDEKLAFLERPKDKLSKRSVVEAWRLAVALGIALIALVAGAREQLLKLDPVFGIIAVFLIGFGADSIKHLFTKRTT